MLSFSALLSVASVTTRASADAIPSTCRAGLLVGVSEQDAEDVVVAVCAAAKKKETAGLVRVSVVGAGEHLRVGVSRLTDTAKPEETVHADAPSVAAAIRIAPALLDAFDGPPVPAAAPPPASPPPPVPVPAPAPPPPPDTTEEAPNDKPSAIEAKAGPPAGMIGAHGSSGVAGGAVGFGAGASVGIDHRSAQGFIDYSNSSSSTAEQFHHELVTIGARLKLSRASFKPVIGGGWSYVDYQHTAGAVRTTGAGIGVFAEAGALYAIGNHQLLGLARWNLGLYSERQYAIVPTTTYSYYGRNDSLASSFAFLAGYGYVFR